MRRNAPPLTTALMLLALVLLAACQQLDELPGVASPTLEAPAPGATAVAVRRPPTQNTPIQSLSLRRSSSAVEARLFKEQSA